jgi:hypothetical protein
LTQGIDFPDVIAVAAELRYIDAGCFLQVSNHTCKMTAALAMFYGWL